MRQGPPDASCERLEAEVRRLNSAESAALELECVVADAKRERMALLLQGAFHPGAEIDAAAGKVRRSLTMIHERRSKLLETCEGCSHRMLCDRSVRLSWDANSEIENCP